MDLKDFVELDLKDFVEPRGKALWLARQIGVPPPLISQWISKGPRGRPVPEERAPAIEFATGFRVRVETLCPNTRWQRVPHPDWPHGKPLIDKTPQLVAVLASARPKPSSSKSQPESA